MLVDSSPRSYRYEGRRHPAGALVLLLLFALLPFGYAWELRVCAEPSNMPFSDESEDGFENRIAKVVADELGATLGFEWLPSATVTDRLLYLRQGDCDVVIGVGDGTEGYLTTVAYYRSAPVFVYREDAPFEVGSFDDEILRELRIAVLAGAGVRPEVAALAKRDLISNVVSYSWDAPGTGSLGAPIAAVASGEADVAVVWGPVGGYFAERHEVALEVVSAEPKLDLPFLNLVVPVSMGVRPGDESLRDLLNEAIAARWEEIEGILADYDVPLEPLPPPSLPAPGAQQAIRVGFALPLPTVGTPLDEAAPHGAASAAEMGAIMAEERLGGRPDSGEGLDVLFANTPNAASARRAAERLIEEGSVAIVGGFGVDQAEELAAAAAAGQVPFLNIGSADRSLREACSEFVFHVEASEEMYLSGLAMALADAGLESWLVAHAETPGGNRMLESLREAASQYGARVVGSVALSSERQPIEAVLAARDAGADAIVALVDWRAQLDMAAFVDSVGEGIAFTGFPTPTSQTRTFYFSLRNLGRAASGAPRVALWEASLDEPGVPELSEAFVSRWGEPMDPSAWAAYLSVDAVRQAVTSGSGSGEEIARWLAGSELGLHKGASGSFGRDHQLRQPLYEVRLESSSESRSDYVSATRSPASQEETTAATCDP